MNIIQLPIDKTYKVINWRNNPTSKELYIITGISISEYNRLKNDDEIYITRGNAEFNITPDDIYCFGEIDFNESSEDSAELDTFNWLDNLFLRGICIPARYNYKEHNCLSPNKSYQYTETFRNSTLCRYIHGWLGKPQFTLIFRELK